MYVSSRHQVERSLGFIPSPSRLRLGFEGDRGTLKEQTLRHEWRGGVNMNKWNTPVCLKIFSKSTTSSGCDHSRSLSSVVMCLPVAAQVLRLLFSHDQTEPSSKMIGIMENQLGGHVKINPGFAREFRTTFLYHDRPRTTHHGPRILANDISRWNIRSDSSE